MDSERIVIDLDKICRACMTEGGEMTSVFNRTDTNDLRIVDMLESFSSINVHIIYKKHKIFYKYYDDMKINTSVYF